MIPRRVVRELERQLTREPGNLTVRVTLAAAYRELGRSVDAVEQYRLVAGGYLQEGRADEALAACASALALTPDDRGLQALEARARAALSTGGAGGRRAEPGRRAPAVERAPALERLPSASGTDLETPLPPPMPLHESADSLMDLPVGLTTWDDTRERPPALPPPPPGTLHGFAPPRGFGTTGPLPRLPTPPAPQPRPGVTPARTEGGTRPGERITRRLEAALGDDPPAALDDDPALDGGLGFAIDELDELDVALPVVPLTEVRRQGERPVSGDISSDLATRKRPRMSARELGLLDLEVLAIPTEDAPASAAAPVPGPATAEAFPGELVSEQGAYVARSAGPAAGEAGAAPGRADTSRDPIADGAGDVATADASDGALRDGTEDAGDVALDDVGEDAGDVALGDAGDGSIDVTLDADDVAAGPDLAPSPSLSLSLSSSGIELPDTALDQAALPAIEVDVGPSDSLAIVRSLPIAAADFDDEPTQPPAPGSPSAERLAAAEAAESEAVGHAGAAQPGDVDADDPAAAAPAEPAPVEPDGGTFAGGFGGTLAELAPDGSALDGPLGVFSMLPPEAANELARRAVVKLYDLGEVIVREGEVGDSCFVIVRGEVVVTRHVGHAEAPVELARLGEGALFGEFALLADRRRHATVSALGEVEAYVVPRLLLRELAMLYPDVGPALDRFYRERLLANLIHTSPLFANLAVDQRAGLLTAFEPLRVESGTAIVRQGERAGGLFLIVLGAVDVVCVTDERRAVVLATLGEGAYVGELSLLSGEVATASVVACGPVELAALPASSFYRVVSEYPELWAAMRDEAAARRLRNERLLAGRTGVV